MGMFSCQMRDSWQLVTNCMNSRICLRVVASSPSSFHELGAPRFALCGGGVAVDASRSRAFTREAACLVRNLTPNGMSVGFVCALHLDFVPVLNVDFFSESALVQ